MMSYRRYSFADTYVSGTFRRSQIRMMLANNFLDFNISINVDDIDKYCGPNNAKIKYLKTLIFY